VISAYVIELALPRRPRTTIDVSKQWIGDETKSSCALHSKRQTRRLVRLALIPRSARFSLSATESWREDTIEESGAITLRLNASAISVHVCLLARRCT
jgi:hypothetical protein